MKPQKDIKLYGLKNCQIYRKRKRERRWGGGGGGGGGRLWKKREKRGRKKAGVNMQNEPTSIIYFNLSTFLCHFN